MIKSFSLTFFSFLCTFWEPNITLRFTKEKNAKENYFLIFGYPIKNTKKNQIYIKLVKNLFIFKLFIIYINELN